jgi:predicted Rossmann fold nucleotide-binding protein DprA/Smf involved in DNA uptake
MTRDEAMLKLLAIEPAKRDQLVRETGWGADETRATLERLRDQGKVTHWNGADGQWYRLTPPATQGAARC